MPKHAMKRPKKTSAPPANPFDMSGRAMRVLRHHRGYSETTLGEAHGVSATSVHRLEQPTSNPKVQTLGEYLQTLGCTVDDFVAALKVAQGKASDLDEARGGSDVSVLVRQIATLQSRVEELEAEIESAYDSIDEEIVHRLRQNLLPAVLSGDIGEREALLMAGIVSPGSEKLLRRASAS